MYLYYSLGEWQLCLWHSMLVWPGVELHNFGWLAGTLRQWQSCFSHPYKSVNCRKKVEKLKCVALGSHLKLSPLHCTSRWSCTQVTGPMRTTMSPWKVGSTSTRLIPKTAMLPSSWQGWSLQTRALTSVRWKRLLASAAERCSWLSWVSSTNH